MKGLTVEEMKTKNITNRVTFLERLTKSLNRNIKPMTHSGIQQNAKTMTTTNKEILTRNSRLDMFTNTLLPFGSDGKRSLACFRVVLKML